MKDLKDFWHEQAQWSQETFGLDGFRGPKGPLKHLIKEANEAMDKPTDLMEYVDMQFLVFDAARRAGFTFDQMVKGCFDKLAINKAREWPFTGADEAIEHKRN